MALRINLEIGHEASLRTKRTPEGFTHDWKIFVRGSDNADIQYYVDKVVFLLHETFQKPKRVVKEPPYVVKESGYAGFNLPIEIYLRNSGEPKKIKFNYDLFLQPSGPPLNKVQKEKHIFISPPEDFRQKLLRGGAVISSGSQEANESKSFSHDEKNQLISKPKFGGSIDVLQKKKMEPQVSNSFQELFGPPITKTSKIPEPRAPSKESKNSIKPDKEKDKMKKHSPHKDREKDRERDKSEKKSKEDKKKDKEKRERDGDRSREKSLKKEKSPRPLSPIPRLLSPKPNSPPPPLSSSQSMSTSKHRDKDIKVDKDKKEKEEKRAKKDKKDKEYNKDKHKDINKNEHKSKEVKIKEPILSLKESEIATTSTSAPNQIKLEKKEKPIIEEKNKLDRIEKSDDKKHKHKKKDKNKKDRKEKDEKSHKIPKKNDREKSVASSNQTNGNEVSEKNNLFGNSPKIEPNSVSSSPKDKPSKPLNKLFSTFLEAESGSSPSSREPSPVPDSRKKEKLKKTDKKSLDKDVDRKKKRKAFGELEQPPPEKMVKEEENNSDIEMKQELTSNNSNNTEAEDYMSILRSLQHKIMALKDNADLQKVVQLIAETGQYEISAHTFDFDLCLLDRSTVKQLQDFLSTTS